MCLEVFLDASAAGDDGHVTVNSITQEHPSALRLHASTFFLLLVMQSSVISSIFHILCEQFHTFWQQCIQCCCTWQNGYLRWHSTTLTFQRRDQHTVVCLHIVTALQPNLQCICLYWPVSPPFAFTPCAQEPSSSFQPWQASVSTHAVHRVAQAQWALLVL